MKVQSKSPETIEKQGRGSISVFWDFVMVLVVVANLTLILFDVTYLWFRPYYYSHLPKILQLYDSPILGIESHRSTEKYLRYVDELKYLEKLRDKEFYDREFQETLREFREVVTSLDSQGDDKLESVRQEMLSNLNRIETPFQVSQRFFKLEESVLDLLFHRDKEAIYSKIETLEERFDLLVRVRNESGWNAENQDILSKMDYQIIHIVETNSFKESGQTENLTYIKDFIKSRYDKVKTRNLDREYRNLLTQSLGGQKSFPSTAVAFTYFWRNSDTSMQEKFKDFDVHLRDQFGMNFYRHVGKNGRPVNNYLWLDAPFLIFFILEFSISWYIAVRRKTYLAWFLYPIYHWYDILGLIPIVEFRIFRLIRIYKIFLILKTSRILPVGDDIISRTIRYYSNIIKEEISDMVTIQILTEAQEEIKSGSSMQMLNRALEAHRTEIKSAVVRKLRDSASNKRLGELIEVLIAEILTRVQSGVQQFGILPDGLKNKLSRDISVILYETFSRAMVATLDSASGKRSVESLVDYLLDEFESSARDEELNSLNTAITVELLENVKESVARKKWLDSKI